MGHIRWKRGKAVCTSFNTPCGYLVEITTLDQMAIKSWFPRPNIWAKSGYNFGFWNEECEQFYLDRRATILSGSCTTPFNVSEWRNRTRTTGGKNFRLSLKMEDSALAFLRSSQGDHLTGAHWAHTDKIRLFPPPFL